MDLMYRVLHAQIVSTEREVVNDGETGTFVANRLIVELEPVAHSGGTLMLNLAVSEAEGFPDGAVIPFTTGAPVIEEQN